jgi:hypothetical protein
MMTSTNGLLTPTLLPPPPPPPPPNQDKLDDSEQRKALEMRLKELQDENTVLRGQINELSKASKGKQTKKIKRKKKV